MTAVAPTPSVSDVGLADIGILPLIPTRAMEERQYARNEEEDGIHDPEGERRLLHRALLVSREVQPIDRCGSQLAETDRVRRSSGDVAAVLVCDVA